MHIVGVVRKLVQACAVYTIITQTCVIVRAHVSGFGDFDIGVFGAGRVEVGGTTLTLGLATEEHPVAVGRELWTISAVHLPGCDPVRILWRARRLEALDEHSITVVSHARALEDQHLPVGRERWREVFILQRSPLLDVANLVGIAPVEPDDEDLLDYGTLILRADDAPEGYRLAVG